MFKSVFSLFSVNKPTSEQKVHNEQKNNVECCQPQNDLRVFSREKHLGVCQDGRPDLIDVINSETASQPQLPDVTTTGQVNADCVCRIHIDNNNASGVPEEGIYVQFVILAQNMSSIWSNTRSSYRSNNRSSYRSFVDRSNNSFRIGACKCPIVQSNSSNPHNDVDEEDEKQNCDDHCRNSRGDTKETLTTDVTKTTRGSL